MMGIEEVIIINGKCLKKIKFLLILGVLFSVQCQPLKINKNSEVGLKNFFSVDSESISIVVNNWPLSISDIEIKEKTGYYVQSIIKYRKDKSVVTLNKSKNTINSSFFKINYRNSSNEIENINVFFYSKLIDLNKLNTKQKFHYDRKKDSAPPLLKMSSLQVGEFLVCNENKEILYEFETAVEFYLLFSTIDDGYYKISEKGCEEPLFEIHVN